LRCAAAYFSQQIPHNISNEGILFCVATLNLAELLGLRSDLNCWKKIIFFHEVFCLKFSLFPNYLESINLPSSKHRRKRFFSWMGTSYVMLCCGSNIVQFVF
jgi:hypothetical protein